MSDISINLLREGRRKIMFEKMKFMGIDIESHILI